MAKKMGIHEMKRMQKFIKAGYAGVNKKGMIVDRREHPKAIPIQKNRLLAVPTPVKLEGEE